MAEHEAKDGEGHGLIRGLGLLQATALNMSSMVGVGPFITIPLMIASMGGPQCMLGWFCGAAVALCDGLVWSELAAAMPGSGGTYLYLRTAFGKNGAGGLLAFLFIWQFIFSGPLEIASGYIGFAQYMEYFWRNMPAAAMKLISVAIGLLVMGMLYRRITAIVKMTVVLWVGMLLTLLWIIAAGLTHFSARMAFDFPPHAFTFTRGFFGGLGASMLIAMYDFVGYYDVCYVGAEVRKPERTIPRSIMISVAVIAVIYALMNLGIMAVIPWREAMQSKFVAAQFIEKLYGPTAGGMVTILILWTAFASVFALLFGYSRIPYAAALNGDFFSVFGRLHESGRFPHISLLALGSLSILASLWNLDAVISALLASRILVQFIGQIAALHHIRQRRPDIARPFRMWLYPLPALIAVVGWAYIFLTSGWSYELFGIVIVLAGMAAYWLWRRMQRRASGAIA
jgi:amino acid transporter